jgi:hypothetical protein
LAATFNPSFVKQAVSFQRSRIELLIDGPATVARHTIPSGAERYSLVTWLSIACLDAPLVAITWQWIFAEMARATISISDRVALFATAWLIYLADRLADSFNIPTGAPESARQRFCARHRKKWVMLILLLTMTDAVVAFTCIDRATLAFGAAIAFAIASYLGLNHFAGFLWRKWPLKEVLIGSLFAGATVVAIHQSVSSLITPVILFAILCSLNCISISVWERDLDIAQRRESFATTCPRFLWLPRVSCWALAASALLLATIAPSTGLLFCIALSAILLALLHHATVRSRDDRVALADIVLLTPTLILLLRLGP